MRIWLRIQLGRLLNLAGYPCVVRECEYGSEALGVSVRVRSSPLYTIVTINGIDAYFYRISGKIDGVGFAPMCGNGTQRTSEIGSVPSAAP